MKSGVSVLQSKERSVTSEIIFSNCFTVSHFDRASSWLSCDLQFWTVCLFMFLKRSLDTVRSVFLCVL